MKSLKSHSLPGSHFLRQHVRPSTCPPQICIWRSGDTNCPCRTACSTRAVVRPMLLQTSPDVFHARPWLNCATLSAGGNHVKENTSMDHVSRLCQGCCWCLRQQLSFSLWMWAGKLISLGTSLTLHCSTLASTECSQLVKKHFFSSYKHYIS